MSQSAESIVLSTRDARGVVTLTLNRPDAFNALSEAMLSALQQALAGIAADDSVRVVVLAANGKAFCAGHDLKEMRAAPSLSYYQTLFDQPGDHHRGEHRAEPQLAEPQPVDVGVDEPRTEQQQDDRGKGDRDENPASPGQLGHPRGRPHPHGVNSWSKVDGDSTVRTLPTSSAARHHRWTAHAARRRHRRASRPSPAACRPARR